MTMTRSAMMLAETGRYLAGGVGSTARLWDGTALFVERAAGAELVDVDGRRYVDYLMAFGPLILGHAPARVVEAVTRALQQGAMTGLGHALEAEAARLLVEAVPGVELVCFSNSGSEAAMAATRLARAYTGRSLVVKFEGHYHGWSDALHWSFRPDVSPFGAPPEPRPGCVGIPAVIGDTLRVAGWNDLAAVQRLFEAHPGAIAAVITEPLMCNTGCIEPLPGYLAGLRELCTGQGALLIFDEVITGFRLAPGGAQEYYGVHPDLTVLGKALGGGVPVAAFGGRSEVMSLVASRRLPHMGTYNASALVMAAVAATLGELDAARFRHLHRIGVRLRDGLVRVLRDSGLAVTAQGPGPVFSLWFADTPVRHYRDAQTIPRQDLFVAFQRALFRRGILLMRGALAKLYVSTAHTDAHVDETLAAAAEAAPEVAAIARSATGDGAPAPPR